MSLAYRDKKNDFVIKNLVMECSPEDRTAKSMVEEYTSNRRRDALAKIADSLTNARFEIMSSSSIKTIERLFEEGYIKEGYKVKVEKIGKDKYRVDINWEKQ
jgi:hypothetical protein